MIGSLAHFMLKRVTKTSSAGIGKSSWSTPTNPPRSDASHRSQKNPQWDSQPNNVADDLMPVELLTLLGPGRDPTKSIESTPSPRHLNFLYHSSHIAPHSLFSPSFSARTWLLLPDRLLNRMQSNYMTRGDPLSLDRIRSVLIRLEDTIIFCQFPFLYFRF
jgi:hypothetical protein